MPQSSTCDSGGLPVKPEGVNTIVYAAALGLVCGLLLTAVGQFTAPYIAENRRAEEIRNVLEVLDIEFDPKSEKADLAAIFDANVRTAEQGGLTVYRYLGDGDNAAASAMAVPVEGPGMWGPIRGLLALESDGRTIRGVRFHDQEETPGLGGRIGQDEFLRQFRGRSIVDSDGRPGLRIVARAGEANEVDVISGATTTCNKVESLLNDAIRKLQPADQHPDDERRE